MIRFRFFKLTIFFLLCIQSYGHCWYTEYWQELTWNVWECKPLSFSIYAKINTDNHWKEVRAIQISEQLAYQASENWSFELHYTYINGKSVVKGSQWLWRHRAELEANYTFNLSCKNSIKTRNRLEIRKEKQQPKLIYRLRQRTLFEIALDHSIFKSFSIYNEIFYDFKTHRFNQDRICPFQLTFELTEKIQMDLYFIIRLFYSAPHWKKSAVVGTEIKF